MQNGLLYSDTASAAELSAYFRNGTDDTLHRRRWIIGLSLLSAGMMGLVSIFQSGLLKAPKPPSRWIDGSIPNSAPQAYQILRSPDGLIGLLSYAVTAVLAGMGGQNRAKIHPMITIVLAGKVGFDAANAAKLMVDQPTKYKAFCLLCVVASLATFATVPLALPELKDAVGGLVGKKRFIESLEQSVREAVNV